MKNLNKRKRFWQSQNPNYVPSKKEVVVVGNDKLEIKRQNNFSPSSYYSKSQNRTSSLCSDSKGQNRTSSFGFNNRVQNRTSWFGPNTKTENRRSSLGSSQQKHNSTKNVKGKGKLNSKAEVNHNKKEANAKEPRRTPTITTPCNTLKFKQDK